MATIAYAHVPGQTAPAAEPFAWNLEPELLALLLLSALLYGLGIGPWRQRLAPEAPVPRRRMVSFVLGLVVLYGTLASPIDAIGERFLFSMHMLQHILLIYAVPLLILPGLPAWLLQTLLRPPVVEAGVRSVTSPLVALAASTVIFAAWHIPGLYEWALRDRLIHNLEHLTMLGSAFLMWWPLLSPVPSLPRLTPGLQVLYLLAVAISQLPVFAYLTFRQEVLYPTYETAARLLPLTPLEDQQLGGILMKLVNAVVLFVALAMVFRRWYHSESLPHADSRSVS